MDTYASPYQHYARTDPRVRGHLLEPIAKYIDPQGTLYRIVVGTTVLYFTADDALALFEQLRPEFMVRDDDEKGECWIEPEDNEPTYTLTPRGRAKADGLVLDRSLVITETDSKGYEVTKVEESYVRP